MYCHYIDCTLCSLLIQHFQDSQKQVHKRCTAAEPRHGEQWCHVSKDINNWRLKTDELLPLVADYIPLPT
jgi:pre-mRNA-processing factor 6